MVDHMLRLDVIVELCVPDENIALIQKKMVLSCSWNIFPRLLTEIFLLLLLLGLISAMH